jgi:hypothetical protein
VSTPKIAKYGTRVIEIRSRADPLPDELAGATNGASGMLWNNSGHALTLLA